MNQASFCNCRRKLLIGLLASLAPLSVLHAADDSAQLRQDEIDASPPTMPSERQETGTTPGTVSEQYDRDRAPSTPDTPRGAQGPIRTEPGEQPSEYSRGVPFRSTTERMRQDERRRQDERNRAMPESTYPAYPPGRPDSPTP
ncbi:hypothetical protein LZ012_16830 [Dechloromonas sp. XY25]|uniref:Uncharacterized protein n=1 Tax=Dechloromonas hankyongensis TaxID=2908002 RepID=A0ABS9K6A9_9RHOO|nr:hypothetical protein [Dechloromonas hankyongensis]MCG2578665.1 hypothetical protein [Dechloromonas hankyongensis]